MHHHIWFKMVSKEINKEMWARERERQVDLPDICVVRRGQEKAPSTCEDLTHRPRRGVQIKSLLLTSQILDFQPLEIK